MIVDSQREYNGPNMGSSGNAARDLLSLRLINLQSVQRLLILIKILGQPGTVLSSFTMSGSLS